MAGLLILTLLRIWLGFIRDAHGGHVDIVGAIRKQVCPVAE